MKRCNEIKCEKRVVLDGKCKFHSCRCRNLINVQKETFTYGCIIHGGKNDKKK